MNLKLAAAISAALVAVSLGAQASAAPPKGFTKNVMFTDATPDPSGNTNDSEAEHCNGVLPKEAAIEVKVPGPGTLDVTIGGFQGDYSLMLTDAKGELLSGADVNPPEYESAGTRLKKAGTVFVLPCNLAGTPQSKVTITYAYKK